MSTQIPNLQQDFHSIMKNFENLFSQGNLSEVANFYSKNAMLLPAGTDFIEGRGAIEAYWQQALDMGIKSIRIDMMELEQHGNMATEVSRYTMLDAAGELIDQGKGIMIWKYDGDAWRMHRDIWTSNLAQ